MMMEVVMDKLSREDLYSLEEYSRMRAEFRSKVMEHKKFRKVHLGEHITLYFEDRMTMQYQIQEMLRVERIFEADGIQDELDAYNPLIPDGSNWKATMMVEYSDVEERKEALSRLIGVEDKVWVQVAGCEKVYPICDEDLERDTEEKTSSVHFMRFELSSEMVAAIHSGASIAIGVEHPHYHAVVDPLPVEISDSLSADLHRH
ncbi:MAG: DUF3501 family protein [Gammaproteobacteria bacterium]|nr:DUF3501 family protein [Gammaproteobacteria bacterium]